MSVISWLHWQQQKCQSHGDDIDINSSVKDMATTLAPKQLSVSWSQYWRRYQCQCRVKGASDVTADEISDNTGGKTRNDLWNVTGGDSGDGAGHGTSDGTGNYNGSDNFDNTSDTVITAALVTAQRMTMERLLAKSRATILVSARAMSLAVKQALGLLTRTMTRLNRFIKASLNELVQRRRCNRADATAPMQWRNRTTG